MQPGDLRRFRDSLIALGADHAAGSTFMVLRVNDSASCASSLRRTVDILLDGRVETDLGHFWVMDNSEAVNEAG